MQISHLRPPRVLSAPLPSPRRCVHESRSAAYTIRYYLWVSGLRRSPGTSAIWGGIAGDEYLPTTCYAFVPRARDVFQRDVFRRGVGGSGNLAAGTRERRVSNADAPLGPAASAKMGTDLARAVEVDQVQN